MASYKAIMALVFKGHSYEEIVGLVGCSRRDISLVKKTAAARGLSAGQVAAMSEAQWAELFPDGRRAVTGAFDQPDFAVVLKSMKANKHFTLQQAWRMYVGSGQGSGKKYGYSRFASCSRSSLPPMTLSRLCTMNRAGRCWWTGPGTRCRSRMR